MSTEIEKANSFNGALLSDIRLLIEQAKEKTTAQINNTMTVMYWNIGKRINQDVLDNQRAEYGKQIVATLSTNLVQQYGRNFELRNLRRMMQFAEEFVDYEIVSTASTQLSWSHFVELLPISNNEARLFYINKVREEQWSVRHTRKQIEQKVFERTVIASTQVPPADEKMQHTFKDPYFLDFLGLKEGYLESDLETAILKELEQFILELGKGFAFIERQKRMVIDGEDFYLDLLFFHRKLKRLVAVELKLGKFKAGYKGQMELYLNWLNRHEKQEDEAAPIGLILCAEAGSEQIELLDMQKDGIMVAKYWTELPPKELLEKKLHAAMIEAKERMERKKLSEVTIEDDSKG